MEWWVTLSAGLGILVLLFMTGAPIFLAFLVIILSGLTLTLGPASFGMFANSMVDTVGSSSLATVPLFVLMGEILFRSGAMEVVLTSVDRLIGRVKGRQYAVSLSLSTLFGMLSGSGIAVAAMLGRALLPVMEKRGYDRTLSVGTIMGGAMLAPIIPPSIVVILVGTLADVSIAKLLIAGILPGLLLASLFLAGALIRVRLNPSLAPADEAARWPSFTEALGAALRMMPFALTIFMVMGLILLGIATPSESAATGVVGAILTAAVYRRLTLRMLVQAMGQAVVISSMILLIMACSVMFSQLLAFTGATKALVSATADLGLPGWAMLTLMLAVPFVLFMFVDQLGLMLIVIPIYDPLLASLGFEPVWFWTLFLINMTLGAVTPPFGYIIFAVKGAAPHVPMAEIFRAAWMFVALSLLAMVLIGVFPGIATFLPGLL
jgi:tripartite ATP-independent transporter DctM subunit